MPIYAFAVNSVSRGYHEYKAVWVSPTVGEVLSCEREAGNNHDTYAVAFKKVIDGSYVVVGHVPVQFHLFAQFLSKKMVQLKEQLMGVLNTHLTSHKGARMCHVF